MSAADPSAGEGTAGEDVGASETAAAPPLRGVRALAGADFSFADAIGGVRGLVESTVPGLVFVAVYLLTRGLTAALVAASAVAVLAVVVRLVQRTPVTQAFSGLLGVGIGVVWAWRTGEAQNYFTWGLWVNAAWCLGALVSVLARWPAVGVVVSLVRGEDMTWRTAPGAEADHLRRRYVWATWLWVGVFGLRLAVQVPIWLRGQEAVEWLGTAKLAMGVPMFAVGLWLTWLLVGSRAALADRQDQRPTPQR